MTETTDTPQVPLPTDEERSRPFWQGARQGKLRIQVCTACDTLRYPDAPICARCLSEQSHWADFSPRGKVKAWCRFHRAYFEGFPLPHTVMLVELQAGVALYANLSTATRDVLPYVGMEVEAEFEEIADGVTMPRFRPVDGEVRP